jgi:hypothetical protein
VKPKLRQEDLGGKAIATFLGLHEARSPLSFKPKK